MNDEQLKRTLGAWKAEVHVPAHFRANVWGRIAARQEARELGPLAQFRHWLVSLLLRPAPVAVLGAIVLSASIGTGWWKGSHDRAAEWNRLEAQYVESIDPYARTHALAAR